MSSVVDSVDVNICIFTAGVVITCDVDREGDITSGLLESAPDEVAITVATEGLCAVFGHRASCGGSGTIVAAVGTTILLCSLTVGFVGLDAEVTIVSTTVNLTDLTLGGTLTEASTVTTVGTSYILLPDIAGGSVGTLLIVCTIRGTSIGAWNTSVTECGGGACVGIGSNAAIATASVDGPGSFLLTLLHTGVNIAVASSTGVVCFVEDFNIKQSWVVVTTEVIATGGATSTTGAAVVVVAKVAITAAGQVGVEVVTTTPGWAIAVMAVLVGTVAFAGVFKVVGQGEQEVTAASRITRVVPIGGRITTN